MPVPQKIGATPAAAVAATAVPAETLPQLQAESQAFDRIVLATQEIADAAVSQAISGLYQLQGEHATLLRQMIDLSQRQQGMIAELHSRLQRLEEGATAVLAAAAVPESDLRGKLVGLGIDYEAEQRAMQAEQRAMQAEQRSLQAEQRSLQAELQRQLPGPRSPWQEALAKQHKEPRR